MGNHSEPATTGRPYDEVRFAVEPASDESGGGFEVQVFINGHEITVDGAGMGMDPYEILVPTNKLIAQEGPHRIPIARCNCGIYGCGMTDVTIQRDGAFVQWDWHRETPMDRPARFLAAQYDAEAERVGSDFSWETPDRTVGRHLLPKINVPCLAASNLAVDWVSVDHADPNRLCISLQYGDTHQVFFYWPLNTGDPEDVATQIAQHLTMPPANGTPRTIRLPLAPLNGRTSQDQPGGRITSSDPVAAGFGGNSRFPSQADPVIAGGRHMFRVSGYEHRAAVGCHRLQ